MVSGDERLGSAQVWVSDYACPVEDPTLLN